MLDQDTRAVTEALDAAQLRSGLGKAAFARALNTSPSRYSTYRSGKVAPTAAFLMRAVRIADALADARDRGIPSSLSAAASIDHALRSRGELAAFSLALEARDRLEDVLDARPSLAAAWEASASLDDERWSTLFAALVGHTFQRSGLPSPRWTEGRALDISWMPVESLRYTPAQVRKRTPPWLAVRNIFVSDHDLRTA